MDVSPLLFGTIKKKKFRTDPLALQGLSRAKTQHSAICIYRWPKNAI